MERFRSRGALSFTRLPPMIMSPLVMSSSPTIIRSSVDFPHPDGPTRIMNSPSAMSRLTSFTAGKPSPYCLTMWRISMEAICLTVPHWVVGVRESVQPPAAGFSRSFSLALGSALDRAVGEAGDDAPLEEQHQDDDRDRHHDGRRRDEGGRVLELG